MRQDRIAGPSSHHEPERLKRWSGVEWPTLLVALLVYGGWLGLTLWHDHLPFWLLALSGGMVVAWQGSLQHETIHGHPTGRRVIDGAIGFPPLSLWLPYAIYHRSHMEHHAAASITDPLEDPESHYVPTGTGWRARLARLEAPLIGRLILGPPIRIGLFLIAEAGRARRVPRAWARDWLPHLAGVAPLLWWLDHVGLPVGTYLLAFVYPGTALTLLRSFAEHRANGPADERAAIVRRGGLLGLLFLNNNLHAVHHARPDLPWYRLPAHLRRNEAAFDRAPGFAGYGEVVRRFFWRPQDDIVHPDYRNDRRLEGAGGA